MQRNRFMIGLVANLLIVSPTTAVYAGQMLFGKPILPYSEERRDNAWADFRKRQFDRDRKLFGTKNGMLAEDLENQFTMALARGDSSPADVHDAIREWESVYAKIPSGSQRYLAVRALIQANEIRRRHLSGSRLCDPIEAEKLRRAKIETWQPLVDTLTGTVLNAGVLNNWYLTPQMKELFQTIIKSSANPHFREQALEILEQKPRQADVEYDRLLKDTSIMAMLLMERAPKKTIKLPNLQNSWWARYVAGLRGPNGKLKHEIGATYATETSIKIIPPNYAAELSLKIHKLQESFNTLPTESKERVTADTLKFVDAAFASNVQPSLDPLLWTVLNAIDPAWLEYNSIETSIPNVYLYSDVDKALKLYRKRFEIQDMHYAGLPADSNFRIALGDLLDRNGRRVEARKWYEEARQIYERQVRTGILESNEDLVEQYYMRLGKPKVVAKSLKSLAPNVVQPGNRGIGTSRQISGAQSMIPAQISNRAEDTLTDRNSDPLNSVSKKPVSDDQALFVETPAPPQLSERRKKALADMARQRLERDRKFFGTKNGMLAIDLENQFFGPFWGHEITTDAEAALAEWQTVYAKIPSACQRYLAPGALGVANQILLVVSQSGAFMSDMDAAKVREAEHKKWQPIADKITSSVLNAASANNWLLSPQMKSELQSTISKNDNPNFRKQAQEILERKPPQVDIEYDRLLSDTMTLVAAQMDRAPTKNVKLQKQENSWLPNYFASLNDPDGKLKKEILASTPTEIPIKVIPLEHVTEVNLKIRSLEDCFARLPDSSKERVTADTLKFVESAFASHAQVAVESLLWRVVNAIDPEWLEYNAIALPNVYYFGDVDKAKKLCLKKIEILDMHSFGGIPENSQARYELGDVLDRNGRRVEARRWYEEARKIDERQRVRMDSQENTEFMDHEYNMRIGNLKPATSTSN